LEKIIKIESICWQYIWSLEMKNKKSSFWTFRSIPITYYYTQAFPDEPYEIDMN